MFTEEERAKWRERVARWRNGELVYDAGKIVEKSDNTYVQKQEPILPIKRDFIVEATRKHAAEAVGPDIRSLYLRKQSLAAKQYANQQYQKAKDDAKRAEGLKNLLKLTQPSTYIEAATSKDLGDAGRLAADLAFGGVVAIPKKISSRAIKDAAYKAALAIENYRYPLGRPRVPKNFLTIKPQVRTKVGDVEIDNPNLLYHLDRGDNVGAFNQGAYIQDGFLFPGPSKKDGQLAYSWWNKGKPYATAVQGQPMTRLMTTTEDAPGMLHIRSQNYPIGQWNGKRGLVTNDEYANPEKVDVSGSTYTLDPNYGWRKVFPEETSVAEWAMSKNAPQITAENATSMTPEQWTVAQDAAIARGDMVEAQRLRDLHFITYQHGDMVDVNGNPIHVYHGSPEENIIEFYKPNDPRLPSPKGMNLKATGEEGIYTSPRKGYAAHYMEDLGGRYRIPLTKEQKALLKAGKTREEIGLPSIPEGRLYDLYSNTKLVPEDLEIDFNPFTLSTEEANLIRSKGYSGFDIPGKKYPEHVVLEPNQLKLADAVTYDNNGVRIPLGERDNFNVSDIRYGIIPLISGSAGYGLYNKYAE